MTKKKSSYLKRKPSQLPGGNCRILANFLRTSGMKQKDFAKKTGINAWQLSRMNLATYVPTDEEQAKMIQAGMSEKDVKAFAKAIHISKTKANGKKNGHGKKSATSRHQRKPAASKSGHRNGTESISPKGIAMFQEVLAKYGEKIPTKLAVILMEEFSL